MARPEGWVGESMPSKENCIAEAQRGVGMSYLRMGRSKIWFKHWAEGGET